ncbi:hypothetical protein PoB_002202300 [Plakobranchus ocellatus]|uniref:Uncharacterized protein n=1 Tax=Plakobranchus ocellatus TaxID=259542 RepID=A0AAV3ZLQ5_9GAST|nr:hypothetical protein PoB_002202300 [Plakobranchus ocellatus]
MLGKTHLLVRFKTKINAYIHTVWQKNWDAEGANKLHEVLPSLGEDLHRRGEGAGRKRETAMCWLRVNKHFCLSIYPAYLDIKRRAQVVFGRHIQQNQRFRMRALTILLLVVAASLVAVVSGDEEKHREKRLFGGFMKMVNQFKDRISGVAKDVGKAAKSATRYGFKWASDFSRNQFIDARKSFKKIAPKVDFRKAVTALTTVLDSGFVNSLCRFSCVSAASTVFQSSSPVAQTRSANTAKIGCGPTCNAGIAKMRDVASV